MEQDGDSSASLFCLFMSHLESKEIVCNFKLEIFVFGSKLLFVRRDTFTAEGFKSQKQQKTKKTSQINDLL